MKGFGKTIRISSAGYDLVVAPEMGFSIVGFLWNGINILATGSEQEFFSTRKGLGPLILPHFNQFGYVPSVEKEKFPHIQALEDIGIKHPFQHGIGRYVPWSYEQEGSTVVGWINGDMVVQGYRYADLAGFAFSARVTYALSSEGLSITFDMQGEKPVAAGIHFYYNLYSQERATLHLPQCVQPEPISCDVPLNNVYDVTGCSQSSAKSVLQTEKYTLETLFSRGVSPETSFDSLVVFHPENSPFICIEPLSYIPKGEHAKLNFKGSIILRCS